MQKPGIKVRNAVRAVLEKSHDTPEKKTGRRVGGLYVCNLYTLDGNEVGIFLTNISSWRIYYLNDIYYEFKMNILNYVLL